MPAYPIASLIYELAQAEGAFGLIQVPMQVSDGNDALCSGQEGHRLSYLHAGKMMDDAWRSLPAQIAELGMQEG